MSRALIVLDPQKIYTDPDSELYCEDADKTIANINRLIDSFAEQTLPIFFTRHVHNPDGSDLGRMFDYAGDVEDFNFKRGTEEVEFDERLHQPKGATVIEKTRYSAFIGTDLHKRLQSAGVERVVLSGFMTNFCCDSTARDAHDRDYFVDFIIDATGTPGTEDLSQEEIRMIVTELLEEGYTVVSDTQSHLLK